jgi:Zn-dependent protease with chaperone function
MWFARLACLLVALLLVARVRAAQEPDDDDPPPPSLTPCTVSMLVDNQGSVTVFHISVFVQKPTRMPLLELEKRFAELLGRPLHDVQRSKTKTTMSFSARAERVFATDGWTVQGTLDFASIAELIKPLGVPSIQVVISRAWIPTTRTPFQPPMSQVHTVSTARPQPVSFSFPGRLHELMWPAALLAGIVAVPIGLVWYRRRLALRAADIDVSLTWYRFWRWLHWIFLAVWIIWLTGISMFGLEAVLQGNVLPTEVGRSSPLRWALMLLPPWLVTLVLSAMSREVFAKLTKSEQTAGEIYRQAASSIVTSLVPLLLLLIGVFLLLEKQFRPGVLSIGAAGVARVLAVKLVLRGQDLRPYAVTVGALRDRIFALAQAAGVTLRQLYILPTGKMPEANAFAMAGGNVLVTDHLVRNMTRRQMDAIVAHELGHLKYHHPGWLLAIFVGACVLPMLLGPRLLPVLNDLPGWLTHIPFGIILAVLLMHFMSRRFEHQTDSYAAWLTGDPEALITGLIKLHRLSLMPMRWGKYEEGLLTHPSTSTRLETIARENGMSRQRLEEVVQHPDQEGEPYPVPAADAASDVVFSTAFKTGAQQRITWTLLAIVLLVPAAAASMVWWGGLGPAATWAVLAGGVACGGLIVLLSQNFMPLWGYAEVRRKLRAKIEGQGIDIGTWGGTFVGFAPDGTPRLYENYTNWDFGFVFLGKRFCYVGEHTRFALRRDQITKIELGPGIRRWWGMPYLYVTWRDAESGRRGVFNIRAAEESSMRQLAHGTRGLEQRLQSWWQEQVPAAHETPPALAALGVPDVGEVTSTPVSAVRAPALVIFQFVFVFLLGAGVSLLIGLPFAPADGALGWYVPGAAMLLCALEALPIWLHKEPVPEAKIESTPAPVAPAPVAISDAREQQSSRLDQARTEAG